MVTGGLRAVVAGLLACGACLNAQSPISVQQASGVNASAAVLDSAIAVVNNQVILKSDLDLETKIFKLLPIGDASDYTAQKAMERLVTRALIEQQILLEDPHGLEVSPQDLQASLTELRQSLPACKHRDCTTAAGWRSYLLTLDLSPDRVESYWANRMAILRFIEQRFRSGIRIAPEEIQKYYQTDLLPRYAKPEDAPPLARLSDRIQEILLQQRVNALLGDWLKSLQSQGQVEVLDASLRAPGSDAGDGLGAPPAVPGPAIPAQSLPSTLSPASGPASSNAVPPPGGDL